MHDVLLTKREKEIIEEKSWYLTFFIVYLEYQNVYRYFIEI